MRTTVGLVPCSQRYRSVPFSVTASRPSLAMAAKKADSNSFSDPFQALGLPPTADEKDIKHAYKRLALRYHPDVNKQELAEQKFKMLREAYELLLGKGMQGDEQARRAPFGGNWAFHDWYWSFSMRQRQQRQNRATAHHSASAAQAHRPAVNSQLAGLKRRAARRLASGPLVEAFAPEDQESAVAPASHCDSPNPISESVRSMPKSHTDGDRSFVCPIVQQEVQPGGAQVPDRSFRDGCTSEAHVPGRSGLHHVAMACSSHFESRLRSHRACVANFSDRLSLQQGVVLEERSVEPEGLLQPGYAGTEQSARIDRVQVLEQDCLEHGGANNSCSSRAVEDGPMHTGANLSSHMNDARDNVGIGSHRSQHFMQSEDGRSAVRTQLAGLRRWKELAASLHK